MSTPDQVPEHIPYKVTGVHESQAFGAGNQLEDVLEITFSGPAGGSYVVRIPKAAASPAAIDTAIQEQLEVIQGIHALGPQPHPDNEA